MTHTAPILKATPPHPILIDIPMPIRTPRLILRNILPGDGAAMFECKRETWDDLTRWMPWTKEGLGTVDNAEVVIRQNHAKFILREDMMMAAFDAATNRVISFCGLHRFDWEFRSFEIGYYVRTSEMGKGYATEIANALTRYAFSQLDARRVMICAATENVRSRRVIEKLGFELETLSKADAVLPDGSITGHANYVRYNTDNLPPLDVRWGTS